MKSEKSKKISLPAQIFSFEGHPTSCFYRPASQAGPPVRFQQLVRVSNLICVLELSRSRLTSVGTMTFISLLWQSCYPVFNHHRITSPTTYLELLFSRAHKDHLGVAKTGRVHSFLGSCPAGRPSGHKELQPEHIHAKMPY